MSKSTSTVDQPTDSPVSEDDLSLLTIAEVAKKLRVAPYKVYELCDQGVLPSIYLSPKARRVRPRELRAYIDSRPSIRPEPGNT